MLGYQNCGTGFQPIVNTTSIVVGDSSKGSQPASGDIQAEDSTSSDHVMNESSLSEGSLPGIDNENPEPEVEQLLIRSSAADQVGPLFAHFKAKADYEISLRNSSSWISNPTNSDPLVHPVSNTIMTVADGYNRAGALLGLVTAYEATKDNNYLLWAFEKASQYIDAGVDLNGDGYLDWYAGKYDPKGKGLDYDHYEWRAAMGIGHVLLAMTRFPEAPASSMANRAKLADFLKNHVWLKWQGSIPKASNVNILCSYMRARVGVAVLALHQHFGDEVYMNYISTRLQEITNMIERNYKPGVSAALWGRVNDTDVGGSPTPGTVDVAHAIDIVHLYIKAKEFGYSIATPLVMQALDFMFNKQIFVSVSEGFSDNVDGSKGPYRAGSMGPFFLLLKSISQARINEVYEWAMVTENINNGRNARENRIETWAALMLLQVN